MPASIDSRKTSVEDALLRLFGEKTASKMAVSFSDPVKGLSEVEIEAVSGKVNVRGNDAVSVMRGVYEYLRRACHVQFTWSDLGSLDIRKLPDMPHTELICPFRYRQYINVVTYAYSTCFWDWQRWEREIDWMALHGINLPLAAEGQEYIWRDVWSQYGLSKKDQSKYFSGPAWLPWNRLGNLTAHGGPLSDTWIDESRELQIKILTRCREFGMKTITPGFSGFIPKKLAEKLPGGSVISLPRWNTFEPACLLNPSDRLFEEIQKKFISAYSKEYGTDHMYLVDLFNEMEPEFDSEALSKCGEQVWSSLEGADPEALWVMQGWAFIDKYWSAKNVKAFLNNIPDDRMLVLDYCDQRELWKQHKAFHGKQWLYTTIHNFGGRTSVCGKLSLYAGGLSKAKSELKNGRLAGAGIAPEGIEQNDIVYELLSDAMWTAGPVELNAYIKHYCLSRYGAFPEEMSKAWQGLLQTVYSRLGSPGPGYMVRPSLAAAAGYVGNRNIGDLITYTIKEPDYDPAKLHEALEHFLACAPILRKNNLYLKDLVDFSKHYIGDFGTRLQVLAIKAYKCNDIGAFNLYTSSFLELLKDLDGFLQAIPVYRLSTYLAAARRQGRTKNEADNYERNARRLITTWGGGRLDSYAYREWSGLVGSYYRERWRLFFERAGKAMKDDELFDGESWNKYLSGWEETWIRLLIPITIPKERSVYASAKELLAKYASFPDEAGA